MQVFPPARCILKAAAALRVTGAVHAARSRTRYYCPGITTFSLLPDCFAARLRGTLLDLETAVAAGEEIGVAAPLPNRPASVRSAGCAGA